MWATVSWWKPNLSLDQQQHEKTHSGAAKTTMCS